MEEKTKSNLIEKLKEKLQEYQDDFSLQELNFDTIAETIADELAKYIEFRAGSTWKTKEGYKWKFIEERFPNSDVIPDFLSDSFFSNKKNLCGDYRVDLFNDKSKWQLIPLNSFKNMDTNDYQKALEKTYETISMTIGNGSNAQSAALLLFYLFPKTYFPYNYASLNDATRRWDISNTSPLTTNGDRCYIAWLKFVNNILKPAFQNIFSEINGINSIPIGISLDIQDFIYCLQNHLGNTNTTNKEKEKSTDIPMLNLFPKLLQELKANKQLILTGAPGTGKTYTAQMLAAWMLSGRAANELNKDTLKKESDKLKSELEDKNKTNSAELALRFEFVQFHPGYDYSDFVEGLKPFVDDDAGQVVFNRKAGIFMEFCNRAGLDKQLATFDKAYQKLQKEIHDSTDNTLLQKTTQKREFQIELNSNGNLRVLFGKKFVNKATITRENLQLRYWNQTLSYISLNSYIDGVIEYMKKNCGLPKYEGKQKPQASPYIFIIDEINRADLSRVFGELFYGLEEDYRGKPIKTQYSYLKDDAEPDFVIPPNVYIIGTMNDIDRSVESMDFALRRRFAWHEITAEDSKIILNAIDSKDNKDVIVQEAEARMSRLNKTLTDTAKLGTEYHLGGAYFKKIEKYCHDGEADWAALWENHLSIILREYLRGRKDAADVLEKLKDAYNSPPEPGDQNP